MKRLIPFFFAFALLVPGLPGVTGAVEIATPGPCAERDTRPDDLGLTVGAGEPGAGEASDDSEASTGGTGATTSALVAGPARHRFVPTSVGAGLPAATALLGPPASARSTHPGACGSAGRICTGQVTPNPRPTIATSTSGRRRSARVPQMVVDPDPGTGCGGAGFGCN
ncbi:MAG: hypothetical protein GY723_15005 [bacterium]|nr:hypothetical protein [bacterium]MCP5068217.1 hypothetical protein [bacterium]